MNKVKRFAPLSFFLSFFLAAEKLTTVPTFRRLPVALLTHCLSLSHTFMHSLSLSLSLTHFYTHTLSLSLSYLSLLKSLSLSLSRSLPLQSSERDARVESDTHILA